jgi:signal transduction histidine kinase
VIQGYLQLLERTELTERQHGYARAALEKCGRLQRLAGDYCSLAYWSLDSAKPCMENVNLVGLLTEKLFGMEAEFKKSGLEPQIDFPGSPVSVRADPDLLGAVFLHLLENAARHGVGNLRIRAAASETDASIVFENGTAPDFCADAARLFEKYYSTDGTRDGVRVGLGLAIAKTFLEKMNGSIAAEAGEGLFAVRVTLRRPQSALDG